jgi:hypothetical protein
MISENQTPREVQMFHLVPKSSVGGATVATVGAMNHNDALALAGFVVAVLGFLMNMFFQFRKDKREAALIAAKIAAIKE